MATEMIVEEERHAVKLCLIVLVIFQTTVLLCLVIECRFEQQLEPTDISISLFIFYEPMQLTSFEPVGFKTCFFPLCLSIGILFSETCNKFRSLTGFCP